MMKQWIVFVFALGTIGFWSCDRNTVKGDEDRLVDVELNFQSTFGDQPLVMFARDYDYEDGMRVRFQLFQFYVSDITLHRDDKSAGADVVLSDIALISFRDVQSDEAAQAGVSLFAEKIPAGTYSGISFGLGVSPDLNATQPGDYTPPHPLDDHYWSWARGYVFTKIEGNGDLDGDGTFEEKLTFHIGENEFYREKTFTQPIVLSGGSARLQFTVDLQEILKQSAEAFLDFRQTPIDHTNDMDVAAFISDNLQTAVQFE